MSEKPLEAYLVSVGAAVPTGRLAVSDVVAGWDQSGGKGTLAVCGVDEDTLTLACSAAVKALASADITASEIDGLWWGTARAPMPEGPSHAFLSAAIGLGHSTIGLLASGSTHAGIDAFLSAYDSILAGTARTALVVASDAQIPGPGTGAERSMGSGAVAFVLKAGSEGGSDAKSTTNAIGARLIERATRVRPLLDRYRGEGADGTGDPYDARLYREREFLPSVVSAVEALSGSVGESVRWSVPDHDGKMGRLIAKAIRATNVVSDGVQAKIGDAGSAAPFLGALSGLGSPGVVAIVGSGGGRSTVLVLELSKALAGAEEALSCLDGGSWGTRKLSYPSVLRSRGQLVPLSDPVPMGVPPGSAAFVRGSEELLGLLGKRCSSCSMIAVPPSLHPVCPMCACPDGKVIVLARSGVVQTFVTNHTMPPPFEAPLPLAVVDLDDGARVMLQGMPEDAAMLEIGDRVELELRRYALERGVPVYGFKVRRLANQGSASGQRRDAEALQAELVGVGSQSNTGKES